MKLFSATHTHRHGESVYLFKGDTFTAEDFATYLGDEYEPDREESLTVEECTPIETRPDDVTIRRVLVEMTFDATQCEDVDAEGYDETVDFETAMADAMADYNLKGYKVI